MGYDLDPKCYGQGFQRHLIYTLIKLSAQYLSPVKAPAQKDFSPQFTWILFEEPEAFLHPSQMDALDTSLRAISVVDGSQVLISTHNPEFVSMSIEDLPSLVRICRSDKTSSIGQITSQALTSILADNQKDLAAWMAAGIPIHPDDLLVDMESIKYALWLDPRRCNAFFANKVLLVEGPTETALIGYLLGMGQVPNPAGGIFILDTLGKFNIHRFMNLLKELKIQHAVMYDQDGGKYQAVDRTIQSSSNQYTIGIDFFPQDLETFLGVPKAGSPHRKPQHLMWHLSQGMINQAALTSLVNKVRTLLKV